MGIPGRAGGLWACTASGCGCGGSRFFGTLLITVVASAVVWLTPLASVVVPAFGGVSPIISWLVFQVVVLVLSLSEEIGIRGYLLPKLLPLGRKRALLVSGLVWATWHMPLIFLTSLLPVGNKLIAVPLFYATIVAASFFFGYLRIIPAAYGPPRSRTPFTTLRGDPCRCSP